MPAEPSLGLLQRYFGPSFMTKKRKEDINLPAEGLPDPKLKKKKGMFDVADDSTLGKMMKGYKQVSELGKK